MRFYSTRLVEAEDSEQAETLALNFIRNDSRLRNTVLNEESDPPMINVESVKEISAMAYDAQNRANALYWEGVDSEEQVPHNQGMHNGPPKALGRFRGPVMPAVIC